MKRTRLGMLTPSSNSVVEPVTAAIVADLPGVSAHFARFRVTEIALGPQALGQFDVAPILDAARLLADARMDVIAWNGTSGGWLGLDADRRLCAAVTAETKAPATTSVLALVEAFQRWGVRSYGLVSPYTDDVQERIVANFARSGLACAAERHAGVRANYDFSTIDEAAIAAMVRAVAAARPQAITILCTNMWGAPLVDALEREIGIPIFDSTALVVWKALELAGVDPAGVRGWGRLLSESPRA